jgi:glycine/D-amino acid oxidase-like deaminating enzyme
MHRTPILLSDDFRAEAETAARQRGISLSELIGRLLAAAVRGKKSQSREGDALFRPRRLMTQP